MASVIPGRQSCVGLLIAEDNQKEQAMPGGFKESSGKGKEREPVIPRRGEGSKRQQLFQGQTEGEDSVEKEAEYEADEEGSDHQEDENNRTTAAPPGRTGDSRCEESNSESDRARSPRPTIKLR